ncbi:hypothetical protein AMTRI_Chr06g174830 [Amborella trichopoda]|uniref:F-box domain-containing protein n=1 Tax=Amborella trichopoda TaxID=13333 RepID=W1PG36_AMBTC|nr:F-box/LRR-repeat protein 7 [Amborella trichopoda]XP_020523402.1 F-box/LRR-repeat protein 7 [Amborella trichopoda]XP_020523403.1 F-box/LRR-repeat protein 7 [Amborella trichopoda]XP_020523404.1 F-box/LRR-repeat protein 7 [Amborella trichopoda]XP_020523405.1 F-box/LRR-repeat protein 7 [Amborella trichopoda]XP_020523406.1 F-box/LRR-repeat protein 7 [Amborella trichopoda]XP_020523407.1 F-box/LRR-repeat protein 7 [Amborella trichopoda]ERN06923.1 hypothetical protein AMTR_s00005p00261220 [Ambore|eukprot:XP_020523401.1 F-box/LRR-repeat protein 7 [Amborella trichopoda]
MDSENGLCDELLEEILRRLQSFSELNSVGLVCKRWLTIHRRSKTTLGLRLPDPPLSLSSLLFHYPRLTTLRIVPEDLSTCNSIASDCALHAVAYNCAYLKELRFFAGPVSPSSLEVLAAGCVSLSSLKILGFGPLCFRWLIGFGSLRELSVTYVDCKGAGFQIGSGFDHGNQFAEVNLPLEKLCLTGIGPGDLGLGWLWRSCRKLQKLQLCSCAGTGDTASSSFINCLPGLREIELRTCRTIAGRVLRHVAENCGSLISLVLYDGGDREGLFQVIRQCKTLQILDLRLPLDLDDEGLSVIAQNCRELRILRLYSCCLISGCGIKLLGPALSSRLEELVLVNCDVLERELGVLTSLGQHFKLLKKLDLSYNEGLVDKELMSMLVSCPSLVEIKLRGCRGLTDNVVFSVFKSCQSLKTLDIAKCHKISTEAIEFLILNSSKLQRILVEDSKLSDCARNWVSWKRIELS